MGPPVLVIPVIPFKYRSHFPLNHDYGRKSTRWFKVTFWSPNVGGHQQPLSSGHLYNLPKKGTKTQNCQVQRLLEIICRATKNPNLGGGFKYFWNFHHYLGTWSNLTNIFWQVLSDEQMRNGWPFSLLLLNDEQMSNKVGVEHQPVFQMGWNHQLAIPQSLRSMEQGKYAVQLSLGAR